MKYIKKVNLENFQSHKNTTIEFDRSLNIIVGASDSGKTAILRGIKWALYNDPSGDYFIREGESECSVTIYFSDKTKVKRYRSKSKNTYFTYDKDDNESKYEGFGTSVPDEVLNITGIKKILLDKDTSKSINISDQLEGAFLLSEKSSVKANSIGYLVGVNLIDDTLRDTLKDSRNLSNQQKNIDMDLSKLKEELLDYDYLDEISRTIKNMDKIRKTIKDKTRDLDSYNRILDIKTNINRQKAKLDSINNKLKNLHKVELDIKEYELKYNILKTLSVYRDNYNKMKHNKNYNLNTLDSLANLDNLEQNLSTISKLQAQQSRLSNLSKRLSVYREEISNLKNDVKKLGHIDNIRPNISKIEYNISQLRELNKLNTKGNNISKSLSRGNEYYKKLEHLNISEEKYDVLYKKLIEMDVFIRLRASIEDTKSRKQKSNDYINNNREEISKLSDKYRKMLIEQKTCPLCFSEIDDEKADYIINQYK